MGDPELPGKLDTPGEVIRGSWIPEKDALEPTNWRMEWTNKLQARLVTPTNLRGTWI